MESSGECDRNGTFSETAGRARSCRWRPPWRRREVLRRWRCVLEGGGATAAAERGGVAAEVATERTAVGGAADLRSGSFSISDWSAYPAGVPRPQGPFRIVEGAEYDAARTAANKANAATRREQGLVGQPVDVHEIQPVKFGGSPTDPANKAIPPRDVHRQQVTPWWSQL